MTAILFMCKIRRTSAKILKHQEQTECQLDTALLLLHRANQNHK